MICVALLVEDQPNFSVVILFSFVNFFHFVMLIKLLILDLFAFIKWRCVDESTGGFLCTGTIFDRALPSVATLIIFERRMGVSDVSTTTIIKDWCSTVFTISFATLSRFWSCSAVTGLTLCGRASVAWTSTDD